MSVPLVRGEAQCDAETVDLGSLDGISKRERRCGLQQERVAAGSRA
jgi:hypothetical protein